MVRNTYIYPPAPSMRIISDIFAYTSQKMPKYNSISISGYHMQEAGATQDLELAYTLADGVEYLRAGLAAGLDVDRFAPRLSFFWAIGMNFFMEVAKMRAARLLWAKLLTQFNPKDPKSLSLRTHCQTSGWSLTAQDVYNNVMRTTIEAMAATQGHTQSLHTNALDEALALPTDFSARIARNTQLFLQQESGTNRIIDPWGGSYYVERLTHDLAVKAWGHIQEVESARRHGQGDRGRRAEAADRGSLGQDPGADRRRRAGGDRRQQVQADRRSADRRAEGRELHGAAAADRQAEAAAQRTQPGRRRRRARRADALAPATATAICWRWRSTPRAPRPPSAKFPTRWKRCSAAIAPKSDPSPASTSGRPPPCPNRVEKVQALIDAFEDAEGRRPRILVAKIGQDGHDRGQKVIASAFADIGFDVDIGPLFATADEAAGRRWRTTSTSSASRRSPRRISPRCRN